MYKTFYISDKTLRTLYIKLLMSSLLVLFMLWYLLSLEASNTNNLKPLVIYNSFPEFDAYADELLRIKGDVLQRISSLNWNITLLRSFLKEKWVIDDIKINLSQNNFISIIDSNPSHINLLNEVDCAKNGKSIVLNWINESEIGYSLPIIDVTEQYLGDDISCSKYKRSQCPTYNYLISKYYTFFGSPLLCKALRKREVIYNEYNNACNDTINHVIKPITLNSNVSKEFLKSASLKGYISMDTKPIQPIYIFTKSIITSDGEVFCDNIHFRKRDCSKNLVNISIDIQLMPHQLEVFVLSDFGRKLYFAKMIETYTRLSLFIDFLKENPSILIHTHEKSNLVINTLEILGINPDRLISGTIRSDITYMPRSIQCGYASILETQVLNRYYRRFVLENITSAYSQKQNTILFIDASTNAFINKNYAKYLMETLASKYEMEWVVFKEYSIHNRIDIMKVFGSARIIISTHSLVLANLIYGQPGTLVIECLCSLREINFSYHRLANVLGMLWYGIPSSTNCKIGVDVDFNLLNNVLRYYLDYQG